jgi:hypothetical protein
MIVLVGVAATWMLSSSALGQTQPAAPAPKPAAAAAPKAAPAKAAQAPAVQSSTAVAAAEPAKPAKRARHRVPSNPADARVCLEFPTTAQIIKCSEKYRWASSS